MLKRAFFLFTPSTIYNCFKKAGFVIHVLRREQREIEETNFPEANPAEEFTAHRSSTSSWILILVSNVPAL